MLKQLLTGGSIFALLLVGSISTEARTKEPMLQSQVQEVPSSTPAPDGSTTTPGVDTPTTTPAPEDSITTPAPDGSTTTPGVDAPATTPAPEGVTSPEAGVSDTGLCESIPPAGASGGATRARLQALESCTKQIN